MGVRKRFRRYPAYKDSAINWLGEIPAHWEARPLKRLGDLRAGAGFPEDEQGATSEELPYFKVGDMSSVGNEREMRLCQHTVSVATARRLRASVIPPGAIVFAKVGAALLLNRRRLLTLPSCIDNNMMAFVPRACDTTWALYWLRGLDMGRLANPGAVPSVNEGQMRETPTAVPPLREQRAIAAFLDRETTKVDALVVKKERLIELLLEKRTALVTQAVTQGIDADAPMKDSRVEWLGTVPSHWSVKPLKYFLRAPLAYGVLKPDKYAGADGIALIRILDVESGQVHRHALERISVTQSNEFRRTVLAQGDLVVSVVGTIGRAFIVPASLAGANLSRALARIQLSPGLEPHFLEYCFSSRAFLSFSESIPTGTAQRVLNLEDLAEYFIATPYAAEQRFIAVFLDRETAKLDTLIAKVREAIARLQELRTALISAAVTGKIDVREEAA